MSEEPAPPAPQEEARRAGNALSRRDYEAAAAVYAPDACYDASPLGMPVFQGRVAIRELLEDWTAAYTEYESGWEKFCDLGNGVTFGVLRQRGRIAASREAFVRRDAHVTTWCNGLITHNTVYPDIDEARAAAERLAEERGSVSSENLELVRSICADWKRGDYSSADWAHPEIEYVVVDGLSITKVRGLAEIPRAMREVFSDFEHWSASADEYRELPDGRVLSLGQLRGRGRTSGLDLAELASRSACVFEIHHRKVIKLVAYWDCDRALADLGLEE